MEVVKRNLYSIICGVIAIIAVVLAFFPLGGMFEDLQADLNESKGDYSSINSLLAKEHTAPDVDIDNAEQRKLGRFPTPKVIAAGEAAVQKVQEQSLQLLQAAMQMNRKAPLVPSVLPAPQSGAARSDFKYEYYTKLHDFVKQMNATRAPTEEQVELRREAVLNEMQQNAGFGNEFARNDLNLEVQMKELTIPDEMAREAAARGSIYVSAEPGGGTGGGGLAGEALELNGLKSFDVHHPGIPTPSQNALPTIVDVWAAQLGIWVQEDIVDAIVKTNGNAQGVTNSVVKRLHEIKVPKEYVTKMGRIPLTDESGVSMRLDQRQQQAAEPDAVPMDLGDPNKPPKDGKQSATGRIGNDLYDVLHFSLVVDLDATRFREFMANLVSNRHITILSVDLEGVDRDREFQNLYIIYGDQPVVRMRLTCEALMFREWTLPLMPKEVQKLLNIQEPGETGMDPLAMP